MTQTDFDIMMADKNHCTTHVHDIVHACTCMPLVVLVLGKKRFYFDVDFLSDEGDNFEMGNPQLFTALDRNNLYEKGVTLLKKKKRKHALKCFQTCIKDLNETNGFTFLPQCLRKVGIIEFHF